MNFKFKRSQSDSRMRADVQLNNEMLTLVQHETERLKRKFSAQSEESIQRTMARKTPVEILTAIFTACQKYFTGPVKRRVDDFLMTFTGNPRLQNLLLLAIFEGAYDAERHMVKLFGEEKGQDRDTTVSAVNSGVFFRSESKCIVCIHKYLFTLPIMGLVEMIVLNYWYVFCKRVSVDEWSALQTCNFRVMSSSPWKYYFFVP